MTTTFLHQSPQVWVYDKPDGDEVSRNLMLGPEFRFRQGAMLLSRPAWLYLEYLQNLFAGTAHVRDMRRALVLGVGVGAIPRALRAVYGDSLDIEMVDIHHEILAVAVRYFFLRPQEGRMFVADASRYVEQAQIGPYDYVCVDIWDDKGVPPWLLQAEFWQHLVRHCRPGACLAVNVPAALHHELAQLLASLFPYLLCWKGHNSAFCIPLALPLRECLATPSDERLRVCLAHGVDLAAIRLQGQLILGLHAASELLA